MAYASWLVDVLEGAGLTVRPYPGWQHRGISNFSPRGVMMHHTVTKPTTPDATVDRILADTGSSSVPAPLCNWSTNRDGTVTVIAAGTANHGGVGRWNGVSGNKFWFGDEMKNWGTAAREPWPQAQLESARVAAAAVLRHIGADESWLVAHKEYATPPGRKVDPHTLNMNAERDHVRRLLSEEPMQPPSWAVAATQWHIDRDIYSESEVGDVDESEEFHRQTVFRHRFYNAIKGEFGGDGPDLPTISLELHGRLLGQ